MTVEDKSGGRSRETGPRLALDLLQHQLRSPVLQAYNRSRAACLPETPTESLPGEIVAIHSLCARARRVVQRADIYLRLVRGESLEVSVSNLDHARILECAKEIAACAYYSEDQSVQCQVAEESFACLKGQDIVADAGLFEQALGSIVDNALKYSFDETTVTIGVRQLRPGQVAIEVSNQGITINETDIDAFLKVGVRGTAAADKSSGSGLGLWITNEVMKAQAGELMIHPTVEGQTVVELVFATRAR